MRKYQYKRCDDVIEFKRNKGDNTKTVKHKLRCFKCGVLFLAKEFSSHTIQCSLKFPNKLNIFDG